MFCLYTFESSCDSCTVWGQFSIAICFYFAFGKFFLAFVLQNRQLIWLFGQNYATNVINCFIEALIIFLKNSLNCQTNIKKFKLIKALTKSNREWYWEREAAVYICKQNIQKTDIITHQLLQFLIVTWHTFTLNCYCYIILEMQDCYSHCCTLKTHQCKIDCFLPAGNRVHTDKRRSRARWHSDAGSTCTCTHQYLRDKQDLLRTRFKFLKIFGHIATEGGIWCSFLASYSGTQLE